MKIALFIPPIEEHLLKHRGTEEAEERRLEGTAMSAGSSFPRVSKIFISFNAHLEVRDGVLLLPLRTESLFT
jgi:hypothetical protein